MKRIAIIDYGMCNLDSVARAVEVCGGTARISNRVEDLKESDGLILPGVGSFPEAMDELDRLNLSEAIQYLTLECQRPFLGICLGMQLMAQKGMESRPRNGLGLIPGNVSRLEPCSVDTRIPHIGWNVVDFRKEHPLFEGIPTGRDFYFVHSYHVETSKKYVLGTTPFCGGFTSAIGENSIFGVQFHPEKSLKYGLMILKNFLSLC